MSFSLNVKNELTGSMPNARHCRIAELAALTSLGGELDEFGRLVVSAEYNLVTSRFEALYRKIFNEDISGPAVCETRGSKQIWSLVMNEAETTGICELLKIKQGEPPVAAASTAMQQCCKRAYLRGAFIACGSISNPEKDYHLEFVTDDDGRAQTILDAMAVFDVEAKLIHRKQHSVVYLKDGESIVDLLNIIEAHVCLMEFENIRILKDMRNKVNRRANCDIANIDKTLKASGRQVGDIEYLRDTIGLDALPEDLRTTALLRLENTECSLAELGELHPKPVGRSGVNHRLQKLSNMAATLRAGKPLNNISEQ